MRWTSFFDEIYVINLAKRTDRLLAIAEVMEEYDIPFKRIQAIENEVNGAEGLRDTMAFIFENALAKNYKNILVFEDDAMPVVGKNVVDETMNAVVKQLPENYLMFFLGCQLTGGGKYYQSPNLISVNKAFATHAVSYSQQGM